MGRWRLILIFAGALPALVLPVILAKSNGAGAGLSGGPQGYFGGGGNCTSCHFFDPADNPGQGGVELLGLPNRYRPGASYDLTIRLFDPNQFGAGFEISAENSGGHQGMFHITDPDNTEDAVGPCDSCYITHSSSGYTRSLAQWAANGNAYEYLVQWEAPAEDVGEVALFLAGLAASDADALDGDTFYAAWATLPYAHPGDGDGDTDADLFDFAMLQRCFGALSLGGDQACTNVDFDGDGDVGPADAASFAAAQDTAAGGPVATLSAGYVLADPVRGGLLYDKWWVVNAAPPPTGDHPLYPVAGVQSGSSTFRCKECHGWDYKGVDGAYGFGAHFTGITGVYGTALSPQALFDLLKADPAEVPNGHNMDAFGMTDADLWNVVKMTLERTIDTDLYIDTATPEVFISPFDPLYGNILYDTICGWCHDDPLNTLDKGTWYNFGTEQDPAYIGTAANDNPWEFLHKMRFGHPGVPMPALDLIGWSLEEAATVGVYSVTLPTQ